MDELWQRLLLRTLLCNQPLTSVVEFVLLSGQLGIWNEFKKIGLWHGNGRYFMVKTMTLIDFGVKGWVTAKIISSWSEIEEEGKLKLKFRSDMHKNISELNFKLYQVMRITNSFLIWCPCISKNQHIAVKVWKCITTKLSSVNIPEFPVIFSWHIEKKLMWIILIWKFVHLCTHALQGILVKERHEANNIYIKKE